MAVFIESVAQAKSGKCLNVVASGVKYLASLDSGLNACRGQWIEVEIKESKDPKFPPWLGKWVHAAAPQSAAPQVQTPPMQGTGIPPSTPAPAAAAPQYKYAEPNQMPWWWPSVSNVWASGIAAGKITSPNDLAVWAMAVKKSAFTYASPDEDDIPF